MKRINPNINTLDYLNEVYGTNWKKGYADAYIRIDKVIELLDPCKRHLDVGCCDGYFTREYSRRNEGSSGVGVDISDVVIAQAKIEGGGEFMVADIYNLPFKDGEFDLVHCGEVLEHLEDPQKAIKELEKVSSGTVAITTPKNGGSNYEEHLWSWDPDEIVKMFTFKPNIVDKSFFNGEILLIIAEK